LNQSALLSRRFEDTVRILHVITRLILGGAQENTLLTCEDLIRTYGDDVLLVTGPPLGPEGSLLERARAGEVPTVVVPSLRRVINPVHDIRAYWAISRIIREFRPDVVHTHSAKAGILGRAAAWRLHVPAIVHTVHGAPFHPYQPRLARLFIAACERWAARQCHRLISVADAMTELLVSAGVAPREKFVTIYSGMEVEPFLQAGEHRHRMREQLGYSETHFVVGTIARLFHLKGHEDILRAAGYLIPRFPQVRFLWVGDGLLRARLERQIRQAGWSSYFRLVGLVPPEKLPEYLAAMDAVVHPSLREGLARVLPQALLAGKPVVSYDVDGAREVVQTGETGFLVPARDWMGMAHAIAQLIETPALGSQLAEKGRRLCMERFSHERMIAQIRNIYEDVLKNRQDQ